MRRIISALVFCISTTCVMAKEAKPIELAPDAPDRHVVVPGDTLWGISAKFLKDPYRWGEVWKMNKEEVKNPHRIYPGQVILLDRSGANPRLRFGSTVKVSPQMYVEQEKAVIPSIPSQVIEPYLNRPLVVESETLEGTPRVVALQDGRLYVTAGDKIYAKDLKSQERKWQIYRPGAKLVDPETKEFLGFEAEHVGNAALLAEGDTAILEVTSSYSEIGRNDRLVPAAKPTIFNYIPRAPETAIKARVIKVIGSSVKAGMAGELSIVVIGAGKKDGLEPGHVLAAFNAGALAKNRFEDRPELHQLPDERNGLVMVFRVFDRVSYALVTQSKGPITVGDVVHEP